MQPDYLPKYHRTVFSLVAIEIFAYHWNFLSWPSIVSIFLSTIVFQVPTKMAIKACLQQSTVFLVPIFKLFLIPPKIKTNFFTESPTLSTHFYISYFSVAVLRHPDQRWLKEREFIYICRSRWVRVHHGRRYNNHIFNHKNKTRKENWK